MRWCIRWTALVVAWWWSLVAFVALVNWRWWWFVGSVLIVLVALLIEATLRAARGGR